MNRSYLRVIGNNYFILIFISGAILLATVYHAILFLHRGTKLLGHYSIYLACTFSYCLFRLIFLHGEPAGIAWMNPDEVLQMACYIAYVNFIGTALRLDKHKERAAYMFVRVTPWVITGYIVLQAVQYVPGLSKAMMWAAITIRCYLLLVGLYMLLQVLRNRQLLFYNYLAAGAVSIILFGLVSSYASIFRVVIAGIGPLSWLTLGFFFDIIFFSAAIGYNIRTEALEREEALQTILVQQEVLAQKELEKKEAIYTAQLRERLRMAKDLHDDIGATLSSISIYSEAVRGQVKEKLPQLEAVLNKIGENSREMVSNMSDIIWALNPDNDNTEKLVNRIEANAKDMCASRNIHLHFTADPALAGMRVSPEQRKNIFLVFKEALNNAVKYSGATNIKVELLVKGTKLSLLVKDDGCGFDMITGQKGNGLKNMELRAKEAAGDISIVSQKESGTAIRLECTLSP